MRWPEPVRRVQPLFGGLMALARHLRNTSGRLLAVVVVLTFLGGATSVASAVVAGMLIGRLPPVLQGDGLDNGVGTLLVVLVGFLFLREVFRLALTVVSATLKRRTDGALRERVLRVSLGPVGVSHLEDPAVRDVFASARNLSPFNFSPGDAAEQFGPALLLRVEPILAVLVIAWYEPLLGLATLVAWMLSQLLAMSSVLRLVTSSAFGFQSADIVYQRELVLSGAPAKEVRIFGLSGWLNERFTGLARAKLNDAIRQRRGLFRGFLAAGVAFGVGLAGALAWVVWLAGEGQLDPSSGAVLVLVLFRLFSQPVLGPDVPIMYGLFAIPAIAQAEEMVISSPVVSAVATPAQPTAAPALANVLELRDVWFRYRSDGDDVLRGLDLTIAAGQRVALVGLNGSGKTTLVKLLCRLYDPHRGAIAADGVDLRDMDPAQWRRRLGVLFQDYIRYELTVADNVALAFPGADRVVSATEQRAAELSDLAPLVDLLPHGWNTMLSVGRTGGVALSGGQWQRVALARAMHAVGAGARLVILDEPTANLDPRGEQEFFNSVLDNPALRVAADGSPITTLLISHRFATVRYADRIIVLGDGRIAEDGTHEELVDRGGRYSQLFEAQSSAYRERAVS
jgi:ATP-binding cassette subfamily B protein